MEVNLIKNVDKEKIFFSSFEHLAQVVEQSKLIMFTHKAQNIDLIAAKDTGKNWPVEAYALYAMEKDPKASMLMLMKYQTGAYDRGEKAFNMVINRLKQQYNFNFKYDYESSKRWMYRMKDKKDKNKNQSIEFGSFENSDGLANFTIPNGGYPFLIHIDEPVLQGDRDVTSDKKWLADTKTIIDTVRRHYRDYKLTNPYHEPLPFKVITTMNDWAPNHLVSKRAQKFFPRMQFLDWVLGIEYSSLLKLWKDKITGFEVVMELKEVIDKHWEEIKVNVLKNHTKWVYVEKDEFGRVEDRLIGRMQKFANPNVREDEESREAVLFEMYNTLITGDDHGLANVFGMGFGGTADEDKRFFFKAFRPINTEALFDLNHRRELLGFSIGWDHDANRGPVGTPCILSGVKNERGLYKDLKITIHKQIILEGYGKGEFGQNTALYHEMMINESQKALKYYTNFSKLKYGTYAIFDDDDGSYVNRMTIPLGAYGYDYVAPLPNKNGKIEDGGFGVESRDKVWEVAIDTEKLLVDDTNEMLVEWLKQVPRKDTASGGIKRSTEGEWGKRYKDISNSAEYSWWPFRFFLMSSFETL